MLVYTNFGVLSIGRIDKSDFFAGKRYFLRKVTDIFAKGY